MSAVRLVVLFVCLPATAAADTWLIGDMVDVGAHPRTLLGPGDREAVRERLGREPYETLLARTLYVANWNVDLAATDTETELQKADVARAAAFLFYLDRTVDADGEAVPFASTAERDSMGARAVEHLMAMYGVSRPDGLLESVDDIHTAEELHLYAEALDLLLGADRDALGADRATATQKVADLAADFWGDYSIDSWLWLRALVNNHRAKSAAALGVAAIVLNGESFIAKADDGRYETINWIEFAMRNCDLVIRDLLLDDDGGFMEGGSYLVYSGVNHLPFFWAWHRYTGGADIWLDFDEAKPPFYELGASGGYVVPNPWTDPLLQQQLLVSVLTALPDGSFPPIDDSTPGSRMFYGAFARPELENFGLYRWAWDLNGFVAGGSVETAPFLIATYDERFSARSPADLGLAPSRALPYAGRVIFRSDWGTDAIWAGLLAEHGTAAGFAQSRWGAFVDGAGGHEHPDSTAVLLYAGAEPLLIDAGYLGWENHDRVNRAANHSLITVDGHGPGDIELLLPPFELTDEGEVVLLDPTVEGGWVAAADAEAWLTRWDLENEGALFAEAYTRYFVDAPETTVTRRAIFLADRFLVLHDRVQTSVEEAGEHRYTHLLHTNCGGTSGGTLALADHGAICTRSTARLRIAVGANLPAEQSLGSDVHDAGGWDERSHDVLETVVSATAPETVEFLTVLVPERWLDGLGDFESDSAVVAGDCDGICFSWSGAGDQRCAAWLGYAREVTGATGTRLLGANAGAYCGDGLGLAGYFAGAPEDPNLLLTASFELDATGGVNDWRIGVHGQSESLPTTYLMVPEVAGREPNGACAHIPLGDGTWLLSLVAPGVVRTAASARPTVANLRLAGHELGEPLVVPVSEPFLLDSGGSCGVTDVEVVWRVRRVPERSLIPVGEVTDASTTLELIPDLPGVYGVQLELDGTSEAVIEIEAVGEPLAIGPGDDGGPTGDGDDLPPPGGCGCQGGASGLAGGLSLLLLALVRVAVRRLARRGAMGETARR